jgi:RNA polymerase sigma-70 factor (ECF subfamily)
VIRRVPAAHSKEESRRLEAMFHDHFDLVWRYLRRLGVEASSVDDRAQEVFIVAARRTRDIELGRERSFLLATAFRIASEARRENVRRHAHTADTEELAGLTSPLPSPEENAQCAEMRALLDRVLEAMPADIRAVFVLFELERMATREVAEALRLPMGTVASRLRRGREIYADQAARFAGKAAS